MISPEILAKFNATYGRLLVYDLLRRLDPVITSARPDLAIADRIFLMNWASRIALGVDFAEGEQRAIWQLAAYDVATRLALAPNADPALASAAGLVLGRLGNFPNRDLLKARVSSQLDLPLVFATEMIARELENTVELQKDRRFVLTDFQYRLFGALGGRPCGAHLPESDRTGEESDSAGTVPTASVRRAVSFSAPTSAGKSFILALDIARRLSLGAPTSIVYVVPTRSLVRQVMRDVSQQLASLNLPEVMLVCSPLPVEPNQVLSGVVYVLTQERLMTLLQAAEGTLTITALYVDEAQELRDGTRGMTLHSAIKETLERFPAAEAFFASPLTSNPEYAVREFAISDAATVILEHQAPVSQMLILLSEVEGKPKRVSLDVIVPDGLSRVGAMELPFDFRSGSQRLALTALQFTKENESTIVYANRPVDAEKLARIIADSLPKPDRIDESIAELIEFLSTHIHPSYALIECLPKGVAYHYGQMPHIVRGRIEDLFREKKLQYICCTSTLLQGVNLPATNIFLEQPHRGKNHPITSTDFWNLVGRVGRLRETFSGNVWCISLRLWKSDPLSGPRLGNMSSAFRTAFLFDKSYQEILKHIEDREVKSGDSVGEQVFGKVFSEYSLQGRRLVDTQEASPSLLKRMADVDARCAQLRLLVQLPNGVFRRNSSISPWRLEELHRLFLSKSHEIVEFIPSHPKQPGSLRKTRAIFQTIESVFFKSANRTYAYLAPLAYWWMVGKTLADLISDRIRVHAAVTPRAINIEIRELLKSLEVTLHYRYVKYLRAYNDVLAASLLDMHRADLVAGIAPLHTYIEMGACEPLVVNLIALGLSRTSAILLYKLVRRRWPTGATRHECLGLLRSLDLSTLELPSVCRREVQVIVSGK